jgi:predicted transcriptional regulator of viral defense system
MQFQEFKNCFSQYQVFSIKDIEKQYPKFNKMNLIAWQQKKYIIKIRNKWYRFNGILKNENELYYIANKIYSPSYVSFETALSYYGIIPEAVFVIKSVSTLKTQNFENELASFKYLNLKTNCFFGYVLVSNEYFTFKIANIEKSLLDFLHLSYSIETISNLESFRLNKIILKEKLNYAKLEEYAQYCANKQLLKKTKLLRSYIYD